jgi:hypothetical protein
MTNMNWQWIIAAVLLVLAVFYIVRTLRGNFRAEHDCPDCEVPAVKMKKGKPKVPAHFKKTSG